MSGKLEWGCAGGGVEACNLIRALVYRKRIAGNFVSIVVRRALEQWSCCQLMEPAPNNLSDAVCSWRTWPAEPAEKDEREPRRSLRLTDKPSFKLKDIGNAATNVAIKWQPLEPRIKQQAMPIDEGCVPEC